MPKVEKIDPASYPSCEKKTRNLTGVVLMFHPQCGHCVQMRPAWETMKRRVPSNVKIVEIDGSEMSSSPTLSRSMVGQQTEGFPTIMRLTNGEVVEKFSGERTPENLVKFVSKSASKSPSKSPSRKRKRSNSSNRPKVRRTKNTRKNRKPKK
jgi:thioredoxin-like negative regulator of GroEL